MRLMLLTALLLATIVIPANAVNYYVSTAGSDGADGLSIVTAWRSIDNGEILGILNPGDTINILPGTYLRATTISLQSDGLDGMPVVYRRLGKGKVVIDGGGNGIILILIAGDYVEIHGLEFTNTGENCINTLGVGAVIAGCYIHDVARVGIRIEGINNLIRNNVIHSAGDDGINNEASGGFGLIYNNTVYMCSNDGIELKAGNSRALNNIVVQNDIGIRGGPGDVVAFNNVWGNPSGNYSGITDSAGGISSLPDFVNPAAGRFDLLAGASEIDAGLDIGYPFEGAAPDIGAFEKYNVYFVSPTGNDAYSGRTADSAWASIDNGDSLLFPGDTVYILPGIYTDSVVLTDSGLTDDYIVYQGKRDSCYIDGSAFSMAVRLSAEYVYWSGINVANADSANIFIDGSYNQIRECTVDRGGLYGVHINQGNQNRLIHDVLSRSGFANLYLRDRGNTVYNCSFYDSSGYGIHSHGYQNQIITNCIFLGMTGEDVAVYANATSTVTYSIFFNNLSQTAGGIPVGTGCLVTDPLFIDPDSANFRLQSNSPAIDAGINVGLPYVGTAPDRGAYEIGSLYTLEILPVYDSLIADSQYQFTVLGWDSLGYPAGIGQITWSHTFSSGNIDSTGKFQPQLVGSGEISVLSSPDSISALSPTMTVVPGSLQDLDISPVRDTISADDTRQFTVFGTDQWGNIVNELGNLSWQVLNNIGTIDASGLFDAQKTGYGFIRATSDLGPSVITDTITVIPGNIADIKVIPPTNVVIQDSSFQYAAFGIDADSNTVRDLTDSVAWTTTDPGGSISPGGFYTAGNNLSPPSYFIIATYQGTLSDSGLVTVITDGSLDYVRIETWDGSPFNDTTLSTDNDLTVLYCRGYNSADVLLGDVSVTWSVLGVDSIGSTNPGIGTSTTLMLTTPGIGQVRAEYSPSIIDTTGIITCVAGLPNSCIVAPDTATVSADSTLQFTLFLFDADGNPTTAGPAPTWSVLGGIGAIDTAGLFTPVTAGTGYIVGSCGAIKDTTGEITVVAGQLDRIAVVPDSAIISADSSLQFNVIGYDAKNNPCDPGDIAWQLISAIGTIDTLGFFDAETVGISAVIATSSLGPVDTSAYLEVIPGRLATMTVAPDSVEVTTDNTVQFSVSGFDADGNATSTGIINWSVVGGIGSVNSSGVFTPLIVGTGQMVAVSDIDSVTDTSRIIIVNPGQLVQLAISPDTAILQVGDTLIFTVTGYDSKYNETDPGQIIWQVFGAIGTIDYTGMFIASNPGIGSIGAVSSINDVEDITGSIIVEAMNISTLALGNSKVRPLQKAVPVLAFRLDNFHLEDKAIEAVTVRDQSRGPGNSSELLTNIDSIGIYLDTDGDSLLTPADILLASAEYQATVIGLAFLPVTIPAGEGRNFIVGADVSLYPHDGDSIDVYLSTAADIHLSDTTAILGPETINSLGYAEIDGLTRDQLVVIPAGSQIINPGDTVYKCLTFDIPRNGYRADSLKIIDIANAGTAGEQDIDSLTLYADDGNGVWGGPSEEIRLGLLAYTGDRWTRSGINRPLINPLTRFYVAARLSPYPINGASMALYIPEEGLEVVSNNDGPIDGPTIPVDTLTIETDEAVIIEAAIIPFRKLIPGQLSGPLGGFDITNDYGGNLILDSLLVNLVAYDPNSATRQQLDSQVDSLMLYLNRDKNHAVLSAIDSLVATAVVTNGVAVFVTGNLVIPMEGGALGLTVTAALNAVNCRNGNTLKVAIDSGQDVFFDQAVSVTGGFPLANNVSFEIDAFPAQRVIINPVDISTLFGGQTNRLVMDFVLPANGYATDELQGLIIHNTGTLNEYDALLAVKLWADVSGDGFSADDIMLGRFVPQPPVWVIGDLSYNIGLSGQRFFITVDILTEQGEAGTLLFKIPTEGAYYYSTMTGPDDYEVGNPGAHLVFPTNRIFAISVPAGEAPIRPQSTKNVILSFALYNGYLSQIQTLDAYVLSNISRSASGNAYADFELGQVSVYLDTDSSRTFNGDSLIATGIFNNGRLQLGGLDVMFAPEALKYFFVVVDVPLNLIDSDSLAVSIATASDIQFQEPVSIGGDLPLESGSYLIVDGSIRRQYGIIDNPGRSVSPGDTSVTILTFKPAVNGDRIDTLQKVVLENSGSAGPTDFPVIELWQDSNSDQIWQSGDNPIGSFTYTGTQWEINSFTLEVAAPSPTLFVIADIADTTAANASFRARIPVDGCWYVSGNDGPNDSVLTAPHAVTVSGSRLTVSTGLMNQTYSTGQTIIMRMNVFNRSDEIITDVTGELVGAYDTTLVRLEGSVSGPVSLDPQTSTEFEYTFTALNPGIVSWQFQAVAPSIADSSAIVETAPVTIQAAPGPVAIQFVNSIPTAVIKGQANVFPMSIRYAHPDSQITFASLRLDSICITTEDASGNPLSAASVFSRISIVTGYTSLAVVETVPDQSQIWLVFSEPVVVAPGQEQRYSFLVDIDDSATAGNFVLAIENPGAVPITDHNTGLPVSLSPGLTFPLKTASCRIDTPSEHMFVAYESVAGPTANYGQQNVAMLRLDLRHPGAPGCSQIQFSSLELECLDDTDAVIPMADLLEEVAIKRYSSVIGRATVFDFGPSSAHIEFYSPVTLSAGDSEELTIEVSIQSQTGYDGFRLNIADSTAFTVRDLSSGSMLEATTDTLILATGVSAFPLTSDWVTFKYPAIAPEFCPLSHMPTIVIGGTDSLSLLQMAVLYPAGPDYSSICIKSIRMAVLDTVGHLLGPDLMFDKIGYAVSGSPISYQPYIILENMQAVFTLGDTGITLLPGDSLTVSLVADVKPDVPYDHFLLRIEDEEAVDIADLSDTLYNPGLIPQGGCDAAFPYETGVAGIFMPAGRPGLKASNRTVITVYPGQRQAPVFNCQIYYESPTPKGDVVLKDLKGRIVRRTPTGVIPADGGLIFETVDLTIDGGIIPCNTVLNGDSLEIQLITEYVISRGANFSLGLTGDIRNDAVLGNYMILFEDSTFLNMADRELAGEIHPVLTDALYPLLSSEISLTAADLEGSFRNFPNPFCPSRGEVTRIAYTLSEDAYVDIEIFTITGEAVKTVARNVLRAAASHQDDIWTGDNDAGLGVISGTYYCRIKARYTSGRAEEYKMKIAVLR